VTTDPRPVHVNFAYNFAFEGFAISLFFDTSQRINSAAVRKKKREEGTGAGREGKKRK